MHLRRRARGFTYLGLIILVAIIGLVAAAGLKLGALLQRSAAEQELLDIGAAFSDALKSYAASTPRGQPQQPPTLKELLKDPRFPVIRRHLRKLYVDPITGKAEWGVVYLNGEVGVTAVYSLSEAKPVKQGNFDARFLDFDAKEHLSEWRFTMSGQAAPPAPPGGSPLVPPRPPPQARPPGTTAPQADPFSPQPDPSTPPEPPQIVPPAPEQQRMPPRQ